MPPSSQPPHHYSFVPRSAETRPGAITPTYVSPSPRTARAAFLAQTTNAAASNNASSSTVTSRGRQEAGKSGSQILETDFPASDPSGKPTSCPPRVPSSQTNGHSPSSHQAGLNNGTFQPSSATTSPVYSSSSKTASYSSSTVKERSSSQTRGGGVEGLKSCLKSESRSSSASRSSTGLLRSESPAAGRESPAKQGTVNFRPQREFTFSATAAKRDLLQPM